MVSKLINCGQCDEFIECEGKNLKKPHGYCKEFEELVFSDGFPCWKKVK